MLIEKTDLQSQAPDCPFRCIDEHHVWLPPSLRANCLAQICYKLRLPRSRCWGIIAKQPKGDLQLISKLLEANRQTNWQINLKKWPEKLRRYAPATENLAEPYLSINQHQSAFISINQHKSETFSVNQHQLASMSISQHQPVSVSIYQHINQHINQHSASINICNWIWNYIYWHKCSKFLRSVRRL